MCKTQTCSMNEIWVCFAGLVWLAMNNNYTIIFYYNLWLVLRNFVYIFFLLKGVLVLLV